MNRSKLPPFEVLYQSHVHMVRATISEFGIFDSQRDDVVQETFALAWEHLPSLRTPEAFPGWVRAIARNAARSVLRKRRRFLSVSHTGAGYERDLVEIPASMADEHSQMWEEMVSTLESRGAGNSESARSQVGQMFYWGDMSVRNICGKLSMKENTVLSHLRRFRAEVRASLEQGVLAQS